MTDKRDPFKHAALAKRLADEAEARRASLKAFHAKGPPATLPKAKRNGERER